MMMIGDDYELYYIIQLLNGDKSFRVSELFEYGVS